MECVICDKQVYSVGEYTLCKRCKGILCRNSQCNDGGLCTNRWACNQRSMDHVERKTAAIEATQVYYLEQRTAANPRDCPDCGGPLTIGEGEVSCSRCPYTVKEVVP